MKQIETAQPPGRTEVRLCCPLNLKTIAAAHRALSEALDRGTHVTVALEADEDVDLTLVQLLVSARRTAESAGGAFALAEPAQGGLLEILGRGGFIETPDQRAFWLHIETPDQRAFWLHSNEDPA